MIGSKRFAVAVSILTFVGLALRLWNIDFGLPTMYHPDEMKKYSIVNRALLDRQQNFNSHPFMHPGLMVGIATGAVQLAGTMGMKTTVENIILTGRALSAIFLTATIAIAALLGAALYNRRAGLLAAAIAAFSPELVVHSRYFKEDSFITPFIMASLLGAAWWVNREAGRRRALILCALCAGFAAGTKFVGLIVPVVVSIFLFTARSARGEKIAFALISAAAFAMSAIMLISEPQTVWPELNYALRRGALPELSNAPLPITSRYDLGTYFLFHGINWGLGWPLTALGIWAVFRGIRSRHSQPAIWLTALMTLAWYFSSELTTLKRAPDSERYILPCIPMLAVLGAGHIMSLRWRHWPALAYLFVAGLAIHSAALTHSIKPDTRELAAKWYFELANGKPGRLAYLKGPSSYTVDSKMLPGVSIIHLPIDYKTLHFRMKPAAAADVLTISEYTTARFEKFRRLNSVPAHDLKKLRDEFPYAKIFRKPWYARMGFHNPAIEMRFRTPIMEATDR